MTFGYPSYLWLLLVIPPGMLVFFWWSARERRRLMAQFIQARLLAGLVSGISTARQKVRAACLTGGVACLLVTLAEPRWGYDFEEVSQKGLDIVVAVDTSKSMLAADIAPNRLARAKLAALDLMQQARSDRLGLVAFAGSAFLQCPLTVDDTVFRQGVEGLDVNTISEGGTALAEAIETAAQAFKEGDNYTVLVLFSDGEDHDSGALAAATKAAAAGLRIFTIGIGTAEGDVLPPNQVRDEHNNLVKSHLNEALLQQIAGAAKGFYLPLRGANTMDVLYQKGLAPLPKSESQEKRVKRMRERYHWPLALALALLIAEMLLPERKPARKGENTSAGPRPLPQERAAAGAAVALGLLLALPGAAFGSPASALRDYRAGKFPEAQKEFERLAAEDKTGDARFIFNAGTAAYRGTNHEAAIKLFTAVLAAPDLKLQQTAYYNLGNAQFRFGQTTNDLNVVQRRWEEAIKSFQNAVALDKTDADAAANLDFAKHSVDWIKELRAALLRAKALADDAARRREYHQALQIMMEQLQNNPLGKQFEDFAKKLKDIDEIANPAQP